MAELGKLECCTGVYSPEKNIVIEDMEFAVSDAWEICERSTFGRT